MLNNDAHGCNVHADRQTGAPKPCLDFKGTVEASFIIHLGLQMYIAYEI